MMNRATQEQPNASQRVYEYDRAHHALISRAHALQTLDKHMHMLTLPTRGSPYRLHELVHEASWAVRKLEPKSS